MLRMRVSLFAALPVALAPLVRRSSRSNGTPCSVAVAMPNTFTSPVIRTRLCSASRASTRAHSAATSLLRASTSTPRAAISSRNSSTSFLIASTSAFVAYLLRSGISGSSLRHRRWRSGKFGLGDVVAQVYLLADQREHSRDSRSELVAAHRSLPTERSVGIANDDPVLLQLVHCIVCPMICGHIVERSLRECTEPRAEEPLQSVSVFFMVNPP